MITLAVFGAIIIGLIGIVLRGWVLSVLWKWFIVSTFGLQPLSIVQAIGVSLILSYLLNIYHPPKNLKTLEGVSEMIAEALLVPFFILGFGWIVLQFM